MLDKFHPRLFGFLSIQSTRSLYITILSHCVFTAKVSNLIGEYTLYLFSVHIIKLLLNTDISCIDYTIAIRQVFLNVYTKKKTDFHFNRFSLKSWKIEILLYIFLGNEVKTPDIFNILCSINKTDSWPTISLNYNKVDIRVSTCFHGNGIIACQLITQRNRNYILRWLSLHDVNLSPKWIFNSLTFYNRKTLEHDFEEKKH